MSLSSMRLGSLVSVVSGDRRVYGVCTWMTTDQIKITWYHTGKPLVAKYVRDGLLKKPNIVRMECH